MGKVVIYFVLVVVVNCFGIDFVRNDPALLEKGVLYLDENATHTLQTLHDLPRLEKHRSYLNLGFHKNDAVWVVLAFENDSSKTVTKYLRVLNPLLEYVTLFDSNGSIEKGVRTLDAPRSQLQSVFTVELAPHQKKTLVLRIKNTTTSLRFGLELADSKSHMEAEYRNKTALFVFFGVLLVMIFYSIALFLFTKEKSYIFYAFSIATIVYQQATYLGVLQMFAPGWFIQLDNLAVVLKVNLMYIAAILFARSFLKTDMHKKIDAVYKFFLIAALVEIPLFGTPWLYLPEVAIGTALLFIYFNFFAAIYIYKQGFVQARFYIAGWFFQLVGFSVLILDGLGVISVMQNLPLLNMTLTVLEAFILSLAFVDNYIVLRKAKERSDAKLIGVLQEQNETIQKEVEKATKQLVVSLQNEQNLLKELHHRSKNNLQLILSLIRMRIDRTKKECYIDMERKIATLAKTYDLLDIKEDIEEIDMQSYFEELFVGIGDFSQKELRVDIDAKGMGLPIKEAGYLGLVVNELATNSIKYIQEEPIRIEIGLKKAQRSLRFGFRDNSKRFSIDTNEDTLGYKLVEAIARYQLGGELRIDTKNGVSLEIEFTMKG